MSLIEPGTWTAFDLFGDFALFPFCSYEIPLRCIIALSFWAFLGGGGGGRETGKGEEEPLQLGWAGVGERGEEDGWWWWVASSLDSKNHQTEYTVLPRRSG